MKMEIKDELLDETGGKILKRIVLHFKEKETLSKLEYESILIAAGMETATKIMK